MPRWLRRDRGDDQVKIHRRSDHWELSDRDPARALKFDTWLEACTVYIIIGIYAIERPA